MTFNCQALEHIDLAGPTEPISTDGFRYAIVLTVDSGVVYFLKNKSDIVVATERFLANSAPFWKVKCLRSDSGSEDSQAYKLLLEWHIIRHDISVPYCHTKMKLLSAAGGPSLKWVGVCGYRLIFNQRVLGIYFKSLGAASP